MAEYIDIIRVLSIVCFTLSFTVLFTTLIWYFIAGWKRPLIRSIVLIGIANILESIALIITVVYFTDDIPLIIFIFASLVRLGIIIESGIIYVLGRRLMNNIK